MEVDVTTFQCGQCSNKTFSTDYLLRLHQRRNHTVRPEFICHHCNYRSRFKHGLKAHIETIHLKPRMSEKSNRKITCPMCNLFESPNRIEMIDHYKSVHDVKLAESTLMFSSDSDYLEWKREIELSWSCQFVVTRGNKTTSQGVTKYLRCSRDGFQRLLGRGERRSKLSGSIKTNAVCPSSVRVKYLDSGSLEVQYISTHVGHVCDIGRLQLPELERKSISEKLAAKVPVEAILDSIRDSMYQGNFSRLHLTTRKDVNYIKSRLGDGYSRHPNDRTSVETWITTVTSQSNIVRFYKPQSTVLHNNYGLKEALLHLPHLLEAMRSGLVFSSSSSSKRIDDREKLSPQKSFFSTRKKRSVSCDKPGSLRKPSDEEKEKLLKRIWFQHNSGSNKEVFIKKSKK